MSLGRKQSISNETWLKAMETIEDSISREELNRLADATIQDIKTRVKGKRAAYAWSGGKDSIV